MRKRKVLLALLFISSVACAISAQTAGSRKLPDNYVSDRCSWFPDGNYGNCCVEHDKTYFFGGTKKERRAADNKLYECVKGKGRGFIAKMMWVGVRVGGVGFLPTSFRWGFGEDWIRKNPIDVKK